MNLPPQNPRSPNVNIRPAAFPAEVELVRKLFRDYQDDIQVDLCFQGFENELASLPGKYLLILFVEVQGEVAGCVGLRGLGENLGEMKRLYISAPHRGLGLGRALILALIEEAKRLQLQAVRLDTIETKMPSAVALYRSLGFVPIAPYNQASTQDLLYMELVLTPETHA